MRLITWNVARRVGALPAQAAALAERAPDVVALQEVTERDWRDSGLSDHSALEVELRARRRG